MALDYHPNFFTFCKLSNVKCKMLKIKNQKSKIKNEKMKK